jgi:hypothetical protein
MSDEIKRNNWSRFLKRFNSANQFRPTELTIKRNGEETAGIPMSPFMGVALHKKGRFIDGVQFFTGKWNPDTVAEPVITIDKPSQIWIEKDQDGCDNRLRVRSNDGTEARLKMQGEKQPEQERWLVEKVAYSMYEHRGCRHGDHEDDWLEAEHRVKQAEMHLIK